MEINAEAELPAVGINRTQSVAHVVSGSGLVATGSRGSSVSIVTRLRAGRPASISGRGRDFSLHHCDQTFSGAHPAYQTGTGGSFPRIKAAGA